jgi:hypothetical protein
MKKLSILLLTIILISCGKEQPDLTVRANVKGLKKGTLYLKKIQDTILVTVDSININSATPIELYSSIESPEVFYLYLDKKSAVEDRIEFFADEGITEINTTLKNFAFDADIKGSKQQKTLEEYNTVISKLNNRNLDVLKEQFEAQKAGDTAKLNALIIEANNNVKRKYLYTVNFALNNKDSEVAPYLALSEIYDARIDLLDTINNSLTPKVKASKYGIELETFIKEIKKNEVN